MADYDAAVAGAGPAGLLAAIVMARAGLKVVLLEKTASAGRKILVSGGGRCNISNLSLARKENGWERYNHPRFVRPSLLAFDQEALSLFFSELGCPLQSTDQFHLYPKSCKAAEVLHALLKECERLSIPVLTSNPLRTIQKTEQGFVLNGGEREIRCRYCLLACGGAAWKESDRSALDLASGFGHTVQKSLPGLSPLVCQDSWVGELAGISLPRVTLIPDWEGCGKTVFHGALLFTHRGISGPAALDLSADAARALDSGKPVRVLLRLVDSEEETECMFRQWRAHSGARKIAPLLAVILPSRLVMQLCRLSGIPDDCTAATMSSDQRKKLKSNLLRLELRIRSVEGLAAAMVMRGGVDIVGVNPKTLGSRRESNLYFAGEMLDIDGPCGGYNLQWAFSSAYVAAKSIISQCV